MTTTSAQRTEWLRQARHSHDAEWEFLAIEHMGLHIDALEGQLATARGEMTPQRYMEIASSFPSWPQEAREQVMSMVHQLEHKHEAARDQGLGEAQEACRQRSCDGCTFAIRALRTPAGEPQKGNSMKHEISEDRIHPGHWRVEAIDHESEGECYVAIFSGPVAQERATEYAAWQQQRREPPAEGQGGEG